ncbi:MAG: iron-sulfur cluster assembly scaffold protein [Nanoarchaeota archaeon]
MKNQSDVYSKEVMRHFLKPKNSGKIENPDAIGRINNNMCGDLMEIYLRIKKNKIKDIKFQTLGCGAAIASSDVLCELAKGKTLNEAKKITNKQIIKKLRGLPSIKLHCSVLGAITLKDAIEKYEIKENNSQKKNK